MGDIESLPFLEAIRQMRFEEGRDQTLYLHVTLLQRHVVEIAADRQLSVAAPTDIAMHQHFRAAPTPVAPTGIGDLGKAGLRQAIGPDWLEQPVVLQIGGDHIGDLAPQCSGAIRIGRSGHIAVCSKSGDRDAEIGPVAFIGNGKGQPALGLFARFLRAGGFNLPAFRDRLAQILILSGKR